MPPQGLAAATRGPERDRVYGQLLREIVENALKPGARLIEAQIAMRTGVSRTPVREALMRLEREGFATSERHHGFKVAPLDEQAAREIFPMVGALQGLALAESGPLLASRLDSLRRANETLRRCGGDPQAAMAADSAFHALLIGLCPNARLLALIDTLHQQLLRYEHLYMSDGSLIETSLAQHEDIIAHIARGDVAGAERAVRANYASGLAVVIAKIRAG
jgi:DNA-binding GntR family transcriptional regulator